MALLDRELTGDVGELITHLDRTILGGSVSASFEDGSDHTLGDARMVVRSYERFSAFGGNRVSLTFSILAVGDRLAVSAVTAGGSEAMFFKIDTVGEGTFLAKAVQALDSFEGKPEPFPDGARI